MPTEERTMALDDVAAMMDRMWRQMIEFPFASVCKHHAAGIVVQEMETLGIAPPDDVIRAIVFAHDDVSLAWRRDDILDDEEKDPLKGKRP